MLVTWRSSLGRTSSTELTKFLCYQEVGSPCRKCLASLHHQFTVILNVPKGGCVGKMNVVSGHQQNNTAKG